MSLQTLVDEMVLKKEGKQIKRLTDRQKPKPTPFLTRRKSLLNAESSKDSNDDLNTNTLPASSNNALFEDNTVISNDDL